MIRKMTIALSLAALVGTSASADQTSRDGTNLTAQIDGFASEGGLGTTRRDGFSSDGGLGTTR